MAETILEVVNVSKTFGRGDQELTACQPLSFQLKKGEIIGIIGESGSGKTTLSRMIAGLEVPSTGNIFLEGKDIHALSGKEKKTAHQEMQLIFQDFDQAFDPRFTIMDILCEPLSNFFKLSKEEMKARALDLLAQVNLPAQLLYRYPHTLSGGQKQRLAIARALASEPRLLICDEVTSALDMSVQKEIIDLLLTLKTERDLSLLFVSHDLTLVSNFADQVLVMFQGHVIEELMGQNLKEEARHPLTRQLIASTYTFDDSHPEWSNDLAQDAFIPGKSEKAKKMLEVGERHFVAVEEEALNHQNEPAAVQAPKTDG